MTYEVCVSAPPISSGWLHQLAELGFLDRSEHDHSVAEAELGMDDGFALAPHDEMLLNPKV
jgi:hypothetical protein